LKHAGSAQEGYIPIRDWPPEGATDGRRALKRN